MYILNFVTKYSARWVTSPKDLTEIAFLMNIDEGRHYTRSVLDAHVLKLLLTFVDEPDVHIMFNYTIPVQSKKAGNTIEEDWNLRLWQSSLNYSTERSLDIYLKSKQVDILGESGFGAIHSTAPKTSGLRDLAIDKRNRVWFDTETGYIYSYNKNFFRRILQWHDQIRTELLTRYMSALVEAKDNSVESTWTEVADLFWKSELNWPERYRTLLKEQCGV